MPLGISSWVGRRRKWETDGKGELVGTEEPAFRLRVAGTVRVGGGEEGGRWRGGLLRLLRRGESREDERRGGGMLELDAPDKGKRAGEERKKVRDQGAEGFRMGVDGGQSGTRGGRLWWWRGHALVHFRCLSWPQSSAMQFGRDLHHRISRYIRMMVSRISGPRLLRQQSHNPRVKARILPPLSRMKYNHDEDPLQSLPLRSPNTVPPLFYANPFGHMVLCSMVLL